MPCTAMGSHSPFGRWIIFSLVVGCGCGARVSFAQAETKGRKPMLSSDFSAFPPSAPVFASTKQDHQQDEDEVVQDKDKHSRDPHASKIPVDAESPLSCDAPRSFVESRVSAEDDVSCFPHDDNTGSRTVSTVVINSPSVQNCLKQCRARDTCSHFTYNKRSKRCHLKNGAPDYYTYNGDITGPRSCDSSCFLGCVTYTGSLLKKFSTRRQAPECQSACYATRGCRAFVWQKGNCQLYEGGFSARRTISDLPTLAGPRSSCDEGGDLRIAELTDGHSLGACFQSGDIGSTTPDVVGFQQAPSAAACQQRCASNPACSHYTYNTESRNCYLKKGPIRYYKRIFDVTGSRTCMPP